MIRAARILVADDDPVALDLLVEVLRGEGYEAVPAGGGIESLAAARLGRLDAALVDLRMPDLDGLQVLKELRNLQPGLPVIVLTAFADMSTAIGAIRAGAYDYLSKPFRMDDIRAMLGRALRTAAAAGAGAGQATRRGEPATALLVGKSPAMVAVYKRIARIADLDATVLLIGETGTGKEQVARTIHSGGARAALPFAAVDCASLPETLFESELFGHERGAFTGAHAQHPGILETAGAGTCFLDEIGELPLALQGKLLRALQERTIRRVGGNQTLALRARVIAATNCNLADLVREGRFREDLFYRLNVVDIRIPPLRERAEDIPSLVEHFLAKHDQGRLGGPPRLAPETLARLSSYHWPGNVRELENVIQRIVALSPATVILPEDLPEEVRSAASAAPAPEAALTLRQLKRQQVIDVLERVDGNKLKAARILGIDRRTLYRILARDKEQGGARP